MVALAAACLAIGLLPGFAARVVLPIAADLSGATGERAHALAAPALDPLGAIGKGALVAAGVAAALALLRSRLLARRSVERGPTWGCGYGAPSARMQYTASSFADPLLGLARSVLKPHVHDRRPAGYFPGAAERSTHTGDLADERAWRPAVRVVARVLSSARWLQQGRLQLYLLYILVTVVSLLLWQLASAEGGS
jgi:hypothetical protein